MAQNVWLKFSLNPLKKPLTRKIFTEKTEPFFKTWQNCSSGQFYHLNVEVLQTCSAFFVCVWVVTLVWAICFDFCSTNIGSSVIGTRSTTGLDVISL